MDILRVNFNIGYVSQMSDLPILIGSLNLRNLFAIHPLLSYASGDRLSRINALPQKTSQLWTATPRHATASLLATWLRLLRPFVHGPNKHARECPMTVYRNV